MENSLKIDIHTHILPEKFPPYAQKFKRKGFIQLDHLPQCDHHGRRLANMVSDGKFFRQINSNCWDPAQRIVEMDAMEVAVQVLSPVPVTFAYWAHPEQTLEMAKFLNDHIDQVVQRHPKRFIGLGTVPLQDPQRAAAEVERLAHQTALNGVEIGTHIGEKNLGDSEFLDFFRTCEELGMAVFVHPWDMMGMSTMPKYWLPWLVGMPAETSRAICSLIFGGVFEKCPQLQVAFAHGGGSFPFTLGRIQRGFEVRPDLCAVDNPHPPTKYLKSFYLDGLVHSPQALNYLLQTFGAERVALGSDYPFPLGECEPQQKVGDTLKQAQELYSLGPRDMDYLHHQSALNWLGLSKEDFNG